MQFIVPEWPAPANIKAYTTVRQGWGNYSPTATGFHTADAKETCTLMALLALPHPPVWLSQVHGTTILEAIPQHRNLEADASFSISPNQVCVVVTADCLPVLLCHKEGTHVAAIHAGWRGLAAGIIEKTISKLNQPSHKLIAWLGPAIGPEKFEVDEDVLLAFTQVHPYARRAFTPNSKGKWQANLYELAKIRLNEMGIANTDIFGGNFCTYQNETLFYSYRRDNKKTGRMASLIWIVAK